MSREDGVSEGRPRIRDVTAVVVTFHPSTGCARLLSSLDRQCGSVVVVDNGSTPSEVEALRGACALPGIELLELGRNTGIARAQNIGIEHAREHGARFVLLSDDDSFPEEGMVEQLLAGMASAGRDAKVAAVGPLVGEEKAGADQLVYVSRQWGPRRANREELQENLVPVAFLIASGCLISLVAFDAVGPMDEDLFIDHVDLQWGMRARRAGFELLVVPRARMAHSLGDENVHLPGRAQPIHVHGPVRNYYLARNTVILVRSGLLPVPWRIGYLIWLAKYAAFNILLIDRHKERASKIFQGIRDGLRGRGGPYQPKGSRKIPR